MVFGATYGIFKFFDGNVSKETLRSFSGFLQNHSYEPYLGILPEIIQRTFDRTFGTRHFSLRCILASALASVLSLSLIISISFLWNYEDFLSRWIGKPFSVEDKWVTEFITWISRFSEYTLFFVAILIWAIWC